MEGRICVSRAKETGDDATIGRERERERGQPCPKDGKRIASTRRNARGKVSPMKFFSPGTFSTAMNMQAKVAVTTTSYSPLTREEPIEMIGLHAPSKIIRR